MVTRVQAVGPERLERLLLPVSLKDVLDSTVKLVNFVKARPLNSRIFTAFSSEMGSDHVTLLLDTDVHWLSRGKVLTGFFELKHYNFFY